MRVIWYSMVGALVFTAVELYVSRHDMLSIAPVGNIIGVWVAAIGMSAYAWTHYRKG